MSTQKIKLNVSGLSFSQTKSGAYALFLSEDKGERRIPIIIGGVEAQSIAMKMENIESPRPLTHDLFYMFANSFSVKMLEANIFKLDEGIFYTEIIFGNRGQTIRFDARTSDAVALAVRFGCPIYTYEEILEKAGVILEDGKSDEHNIANQKDDDSLDPVSTDALKKLLNDAIAYENYEKASALRDEINKREKISG